MEEDERGYFLQIFVSIWGESFPGYNIKLLSGKYYKASETKSGTSEYSDYLIASKKVYLAI